MSTAITQVPQAALSISSDDSQEILYDVREALFE